MEATPTEVVELVAVFLGNLLDGIGFLVMLYSFLGFRVYSHYIAGGV